MEHSELKRKATKAERRLKYLHAVHEYGWEGADELTLGELYSVYSKVRKYLPAVTERTEFTLQPRAADVDPWS